MTDRKAQLVTLRAFLMLAVINAAVATFQPWLACGRGPRSYNRPLVRLGLAQLAAVVRIRGHPTNL